MPLKVYQRKSGFYHIRGTHHGIRVDESARTRSRQEAEGVREKREREIFEDVIYKRPQQHSFAEAAIDYMKGGGERRYLEPILAATLKLDGRVVRFGEVLLHDIDEALIYDLAGVVKPGAKAATVKRAIFTPVMSVLNKAARQPKKFGYSGVSVERPKVDIVRPDWKMPDEIEWWLERCGHLVPLVTAYVGTGARASELTNLEWRDVSLGNRSVDLWEEDTKSSVARTLLLQQRVRDCWPCRGKGRVFLNSRGMPWNDTRAINTFLWRITEREARAAADRAEHQELQNLKRLCRTLPVSQRPVNQYRALLVSVAERKDVPRLHLHSLRHTWATWAYAVTKDITWVKEMGGWASADLVHRYMRYGGDDLASAVRAHGWTMREEVAPASIAVGKQQGSKA